MSHFIMMSHVFMISHSHSTWFLVLTRDDYFYISVYCCRLLGLIEDFQRGVHLRNENYTLSATNMEIFIVKLTSVEKQGGLAYKPNEEGAAKVEYCNF